MNMAADLECSGNRKGGRQDLTWRLFARIVGDGAGIDIDLMKELVVVSEFDGVADMNGDCVGVKGAALLNDGVVPSRCGWHQQRQHQEQPQSTFHRLTTSPRIGAKIAKS